MAARLMLDPSSGAQPRSSSVIGALLLVLFTSVASRGQGQACSTTPPFQDPQSTLVILSDHRQIIKNVMFLRGHVIITYQDMRLTADRATYNRTTGDMEAAGHVVFDDPHGHVDAAQAHYNVMTGKGWFLHAHGYIRFSTRDTTGKTEATPLFIRAEEVVRVNEDTYSIDKGDFSTCEKERNGLAFGMGEARLEIGHSLRGRQAVFRFLGLPVFYLPFLAVSASRTPRHSGFLLPEIGSDTQKGFMLGSGFYWVLNPSADLLLGAEYYSLRGLGVSGRFRATPSATSTLEANFFAIDDSASGPLRDIRTPGGSFNITGDSANLGDGFQGVVDVDYVNSLAFRETWANNFNAAVSSEASQMGFLTRDAGPYNLSLYASRYQDFLSAAPVNEQSIIIRQYPTVSFSGLDNELGTSPFYFSFDTSAGGVGRSEPGFSTPTISERIDAAPELTLRLKPLWGFDLTPTFGIRDTFYGTSFKPDRGGLNRALGDVSVDLRPPSLEKVFNRPFWGHRVEHVIESDIHYHLVKSPDPRDILDVVPFDTLDLLTEDNEIDYSVTNSILWRKDAQPGKPKPRARDLLSWTLTQAYFFDPTFGGAISPGAQVAIEPTLNLTGFSFPEGRNLSPIDSILKFSPTSNLDAEFRTDIDPQRGGVLNAGATSRFHVHSLDVAFTDFFINHTKLLPAPIAPTIPLELLPTFNLLDLMASYSGFIHKRLSAAFRVDYNLSQGIAEDYVEQISYNFGCFALNGQVQRFNLGFIRNENAFSVSISLGRIGTFGSFKPGQFIERQLQQFP